MYNSACKYTLQIQEPASLKSNPIQQIQSLKLRKYLPRRTEIYNTPMHPLVIKRGKLGNPLEMQVSMGKSLINGPFSIAMSDSRRVYPVYADPPQKTKTGLFL